ncbi:MAG TPA: peroxide stress protein YaaA [Mariprofundaceae bacterium]|nr:peroxide stress protein YaaA [Mariprofundaceae bacterium]
MLIVISPAKKLALQHIAPPLPATLPAFLDRSAELVGILRDMDSFQLSELMGISMKLADLNMQRFQTWHTPFTPANASPALLAFQGDVYQGLQAETLDAEGLAFAQQHLCILSGLYGLLRPLDLMQDYRLEMGTSLANPHGRDLYAFWGDAITEALNRALSAQDDDVLVNLASQEYFKAVRPGKLVGRIVTPLFREKKAGGYKIVGIMAKRARGLMSRYIIDRRISDPEALKEFSIDGYRFNPKLSDDREWSFTRG